eukprot:14715497-Heterocapsa_arctica.AAC.1
MCRRVQREPATDGAEGFAQAVLDRRDRARQGRPGGLRRARARAGEGVRRRTPAFPGQPA